MVNNTLTFTHTHTTLCALRYAWPHRNHLHCIELCIDLLDFSSYESTLKQSAWLIYYRSYSHHNQTTRNSLGFIYFSPCFSFTKQKFAIIVAVTEESVREEHFLHDLCLLGAVTAEITQILTRAGFTLRKYSWTPLKLQTGLVMWWSEIIYCYTQRDTHLAYTCFAWTWYIFDWDIWWLYCFTQFASIHTRITTRDW